MADSANRFKNVLLCILPVKKADVQLPQGPYCGIGYIAEALRRNGINYRFADLRLRDVRNRVFDMVKESKPDLIGVTMFSQSYRYGYDFLTQIKRAFPETAIAVGGPHASCFGNEMLEECAAIDYGAAIEGDDTIVELCRGLPLDKVLGLLYRDRGAITYTGDRGFIYDLDRLGFPIYEGFCLERYAVMGIPISTSRGCHALCTFCTVACTHGRRVRKRSAGSVAEEISYWYGKGYRFIHILDDNFTVDRKRVVDLCGMLRSAGLKGLQIKLDNGVRADSVDKELLEEMLSAGINKISFGVESANERILKNIKKGESLAVIEKAVRLALNTGMQVHLTFIIGLPGESAQEVLRSFEFARRLGVHNAQFYPLIPYPGSELFEWAKAGGYLLYRPEEYLNFITDAGRENTALLETPQLSKESRERLYEEGRSVTRTIEREKQTFLLERRFGTPLAKALIFIYTSAIFEWLFERSFLMKRYVFRLRAILNV